MALHGIPEDAVYLGDGAYARFDSGCIWLTTSNGIQITNEICLEPEVYMALLEFGRKVMPGVK